MNSAKRLLIAAGLWILPALTHAESQLPIGSSGEVTLNWQKFNDIWTKMQALEKQVEALQKPEHLPPVPFTITKAAYKGTVHGRPGFFAS